MPQPNPSIHPTAYGGLRPPPSTLGVIKGPSMDNDTEIQRAIEAEFARLDSEPAIAKVVRATAYWGYRALVRLVWILFGIVLAAAALWCGSFSIDLFNKPIASLTLANLLQLALALLGALVTGVSALMAVFAPPVSGQDRHARVAAAVRDRLSRRQAEAAEIAALQSQAAKWYRHGRFVGLLFDASLAKRHKWLPFAAVVTGYLLIGLGVAIVTRYSS